MYHDFLLSLLAYFLGGSLSSGQYAVKRFCGPLNRLEEVAESAVETLNCP